MLLLFETSAGYALFKMLDESKLDDPENIISEFSDKDKRSSMIQLHKFQQFNDMEEAAEATKCLQDSEKLHKSLSKFLKKNIIKKKLKDSLGVLDPKLGGLIRDKFDGLDIVHNQSIMALQRGIREHIIELLGELTESESTQMKLGLSHSLSRHKLKFSSEKVDTMIVQAIALLDELDKEINIYAMRVKEWYGWHFPEMSRCISDNIKYCKIIKECGFRSKIREMDLSNILEKDEETDLKNNSKISMGSQITQEDLDNIMYLSDQVLDLSEYRVQLYEYLKNRMLAIAPTLTLMVGELVGARLLAHAGSLISLAKYPASTIQLLGAEKALFRALKQKSNTPKYGLIYHASYVNGASQANKGKMARVLACKTILGTRIDAFTSEARSGVSNDDNQNEDNKNNISIQSQKFATKALDHLQKRLNKYEGRTIQIKSKTLAGNLFAKHEFSSQQETYDTKKDIKLEKSPRKRKLEDDIEEEEEKEIKSEIKEEIDSEKEEETVVKPPKKKKTKKKKKI